jgi:ABC-type Fe3+/spermidine/putrescine transport system ATPase subunit
MRITREQRAQRPMSSPPGLEDASPRPLLSLTGAVRRYGKVTAVNGIDLEVRPGEMFGLLGPSGCGKSTTLRAIAGLESLDGGRLVLNDRVLDDGDAGVLVPTERRNIAMVFQSYAIWPHMTVGQNVAFPLKIRRTPRREVRSRVEEVLRMVGLADYVDRPATALSGGQQQRVALARALVYRPELLLLDEPLSNLDTKLREEMRTEICRLRDELGLTIIFVTHDQYEAMSMSDRMAVMNGGDIEQVGSPAELYEQPRSQFVRDFLGKVVTLPGAVALAGAEKVVVLDALGPGTPVPVPVPDSLAVGARVSLVSRPEDLNLRSAPSQLPGTVTIPAQVATTAYLGDHIEYSLSVGDTRFVASGSRRDAVRPGGQTFVELTLACLSLWPA